MALSAHILQGLANSSTRPDELERYQAHTLPIDFSLPAGESFDGQDALILELRIKGVTGLPGRLQTVVLANPSGSTARLILSSPQMNQPVLNSAGEAVPSKKFWMVLCAVSGQTVTPLWTANLNLVAHFASASTAAPPEPPEHYLTAVQTSGLYATLAALAAEITARETAHAQAQASISALESSVATKASQASLAAEIAAREALAASMAGKAESAALTDEAIARAAGDASNASAIGTVASNLATEVASREALNASVLTALAFKAPVNSPALAGNPTAPTQTHTDSSTKLATTSFVHAVITEVVGLAPENLNTLQELAAQLLNDQDALEALIVTVSGKLGKSANLSDLEDAAAALANLGAVPQSAYDAAMYSVMDMQGIQASQISALPSQDSALQGQIDEVNATLTIGTVNASNKLATPRSINGVPFDGTSNISIPAAAGSLTGSALPAGVTSAPGLTSLASLSVPGAVNDATLKAGTFGIQSYSLNNGFVLENAYFDNMNGFVRRATGYVEGFFFYNGEFQVRCDNTGAAGSLAANVGANTALKVRWDNTVGIGGAGQGTPGSFAGFAMVAKNGVNVGGTTDPGAGNLLVSGTVTAGKLGLGVNPAFALDIGFSLNTAEGFRVTNSSSGSLAQVQNVLQNNTGSLAYTGISSSNYSGFAPINGGRAFVGSNLVPLSIFTQSADPIYFFPNATLALALYPSGGLCLRDAGGQADPGAGRFKAAGLNLASLPTSATGLAAGDVWRSGTDLKIV